MRGTYRGTFSITAMAIMALATSFVLTAEEDPVVDPVVEAALDAKEDAERLQRGVEFLQQREKGAQARDFVFRVVDQDGRPVAGVRIGLETTRCHSIRILTGGDPSTSTVQRAVTEVNGTARFHTPIGDRFEAGMGIEQRDGDILAKADYDTFVFPDHGPIFTPADRHPPGIDYEFRVIRYPSQAPVMCWASRVIVPPDGSPQRWNPLDPIRMWKDTEYREEPIDIPGDWPPEFEVRLWRDPAVRMRYRGKDTTTPDGTVWENWQDSKVHWKLTLTTRRGGLLLSPHTPLRQGEMPHLRKNANFPVFDTLPTEGYQSELVWDVDEVAGITPLVWNKPVLVYWRRDGIPARVCQMTLTPWVERISYHDGRAFVKDPDISDYTFSLRATFRLRPDGERQIVLAHDAIPTVDGLRERNSSAITPTWYGWATPAQIAGWLAEPLPVVPAPIKP